jgi:hypothetical protein
LHLEGDFGDDDHPGAVFLLFACPAGADAQAAAPGLVGKTQGFGVFHQLAAGWEVRARHVLQKSSRVRVRVMDEVDGCGADFAGVMGRDRGRHADGDPGRAIGQKIGEGAGQDDGLAFLAVIGRAEIDGVFIDATEQKFRDLGEAGFGVPHGGGVIAVDIAKIALAFDEGVARGEFLGEPDQRLVDRGIAVRVIFTHDVADHAGAFLEAGAGIELELVHGVDEAPMHGFETVANVRQRARHDGGQSVGEVAFGKGFRELGVLDLSGTHIYWHAWSPCRSCSRS